MKFDMFLYKLLDLWPIYDLEKVLLEASGLLIVLAMFPLALEFDLHLPLLNGMLLEPWKQRCKQLLSELLKSSLNPSEGLFCLFGAIIHVFVFLYPIIVFSECKVGISIGFNVSMNTLQDLRN